MDNKHYIKKKDQKISIFIDFNIFIISFMTFIFLTSNLTHYLNIKINSNRVKLSSRSNK